MLCILFEWFCDFVYPFYLCSPHAFLLSLEESTWQAVWERGAIRIFTKQKCCMVIKRGNRSVVFIMIRIPFLTAGPVCGQYWSMTAMPDSFVVMLWTEVHSSQVSTVCHRNYTGESHASSHLNHSLVLQCRKYLWHPLQRGCICS